MHKHTNWLLIFIGLVLIAFFAINLSSHKSAINTANYHDYGARFFYNPNESDNNDQLLNDPAYRENYEQSELNWRTDDVQPRKKSSLKNAAAVSLLIIFGVMGFSANLFFRAIYIFCEWREGNTIDWPYQALLTFAVPVAYVLAMWEVIICMGINLASS